MFFTALKELKIYWGKLLLYLLELLNKIEHILSLAHNVSLRLSLLQGFLQYKVKSLWLVGYFGFMWTASLSLVLQHRKTIVINEHNKLRNKHVKQLNMLF